MSAESSIAGVECTCRFLGVRRLWVFIQKVLLLLMAESVAGKITEAFRVSGVFDILDFTVLIAFERLYLNLISTVSCDLPGLNVSVLEADGNGV